VADLHLQLDPDLGRRAGIETALRDAIRSGRLKAETPLPSTRTLATDLGVSRATVVAAYGQLTAEGFLVASHGSATSVAATQLPEVAASSANPFWETPRFDFRPGEPAADSFPRRAWLKSVRRVLTDSPDDVFGYGDPRGRPELRNALASHLGRTRSVLADPGAISVVGGFASGVGFLAEVFAGMSGRIAIEDPMLFFHRHILELAGLEVVPIPVDSAGVMVDHLEGEAVDAVLVTPAHQHPLGTTLSADRRNQLVAWARATDTWIIEDDYDGEFRYDRKPIGALQGLAPDRVVYAGTASKTLAPGLRMGWLVLPDGLRREVQKRIHIKAGVSTIDQLILADFLDSGSLDRHLRTMRPNYRTRREQLVERLALDVPWLDVIDHPVGLHLTARITDPGIDEQELVEAAAKADVGIMGLGICHLDQDAPRHRGVLVGFARPADHQFPAAVDALLRVLGS